MARRRRRRRVVAKKQTRKEKRQAKDRENRRGRRRAFNEKYADQIESGDRLTSKERRKVQQLKNAGKKRKAKKFREKTLGERKTAYETRVSEENAVPSPGNTVTEEALPTITDGSSPETQSIPYIPEYNITPTDLIDSGFYDRRVEKEVQDLNRYFSAKGLYKSGAANEVAADTIGRIRGEETQRNLDIATKLADQNLNVNASNIANYLGQTNLEANRRDTSNYLTRVAADSYQRVVAPGGGGTALPPLPIKDTTPIEIGKNKGQQAGILSNANTESKQTGNALNNLGGIGDAISGIIGLFNGGGSTPQPKLPGATTEDYLANPLL